VSFFSELDVEIHDPNTRLNIDLARNSVDFTKNFGQVIYDDYLQANYRGTLQQTCQWIKDRQTDVQQHKKVLVTLFKRVWRVLCVKRTNSERKALLVSEQILESREFDTNRKNIWRKCSLNTWLNGEFKIKTLESITDNMLLKPEPDSESDDTDSRVFLLSRAEVKNYFIDNDDRITREKIERGNWSAGWWWLRSPGGNDYLAAYVRSGGSIFGGGYVVDCSGGVRPAFWLNLNSEIFESDPK